MASKLKKNGVAGCMLTQMANRRGRMTADRSGFPPSKVFKPLKRRGLVFLKREKHYATYGYNVWHLTQKGWDAIGITPPEDL